MQLKTPKWRISVLLVMVLIPLAVVAGEDQHGTNTFINGRELTLMQLRVISAVYHASVPPGRYWYDTRSGAWGREGSETAGFIYPGYDFGPLAVNASNGDTEVYINGRELNQQEVVGLQRIFGVIYKGHWWVDGATGNYGLEGYLMPLGNIVAMSRARAIGPALPCGKLACAGIAGGASYNSWDGHVLTPPN
jgi:hypothetical protein